MILSPGLRRHVPGSPGPGKRQVSAQAIGFGSKCLQPGLPPIGQPTPTPLKHPIPIPAHPCPAPASTTTTSPSNQQPPWTSSPSPPPAAGQHPPATALKRPRPSDQALVLPSSARSEPAPSSDDLITPGPSAAAQEQAIESLTDDPHPYLRSHIPPVPPLPPHFAHLNGNSSAATSLTPQALLQRLEQLLQAKSHEIQLAGQLGNSLLEQQAELELRISELESTGALFSAPQPKPSSRRHREHTPATPNHNEPAAAHLQSLSGESTEASEDEANPIDHTVRRKVEELDAAMKRWQEGNSEIWRQARGEPPAISRPSTPSQSPNGPMPITPVGHQLPPGSTPDSKSVAHSPTTDQSINRRARNAQHRANDIEFATEIGQSLLGEVRRLQSLLVVKEDELMEMKEEREGLWERNEQLMQRIKDYEANVDKFKEENWNLELNKQELQTKLTTTRDEKAKVEADRLKLIKQLTDLQQSSDQQRAEFERTTNLLAEERSKYESTIATLRKNHAGLQRERSDLQGTLDGVKVELETIKKKATMKRVGSGRQADGLSYETDNPGEGAGDEEEILATRMTPGKRKAGDHFHQNGTPIDGFGGDEGDPDNLTGTPARQRGLGSNLGFSTENDQLRTSLAHAQRTISTLRERHARPRQRRR
ncbi:hypothetical protein PTTG_04411 [Puccinia triticina 1-1 BBBD Race 1]|uniref:Uncharacterized protein n=1 Tax=Puccinia triticina (isolate 1-1 / race 1 (BBBD)) TaxID=630390 RepID=A0A0C4EUD2_PUCT1|nr:hypothetical protein PTTG_04411 [Puccinia triticina 1-1 BBBD Race 1]